MDDRLFESLRAGGTLVTANTRLARDQLRGFDRRLHAAGSKVWHTADVLPLGGWLRRCWNSRLQHGSPDLRLLLRPAQEHAVWERIIRESSSAHPLLQISSTAHVALEAWALQHAWRLDQGAGEWRSSQDTEVYLEWSANFRSECKKNAWISGAELPDTVSALARTRHISIPSALWFAGFDEISPQQQDLIETLRAVAPTVEILDPPQCASSAGPVRVGLAGCKQEIETAAHWARGLLESNRSESIGVVVPNLSVLRNDVERIFNFVLHPTSMLAGAPGGGPAFNISLGLPLLDYPLVRAAFVVLDAADDPIPFHRASYLLRTPFLGGGIEERSSRARLDAELRKRRQLEIRADDIVSLSSSDARPEKRTASPLLFRRIRSWRKALRKRPAAQTPSEWSATFSRLLARLGWPGDRTLDSAEHQTFEKWHELLDEFAGLDVACGPMSYDEAVAALRRLASATIFQPESSPAPIQVLGLLEASGLSFDHLWVMGLHDDAWPPPARPNPFLPLLLQRKANLPHSSPARESEFAQKVMQRLQSSSPDVVFSYPRVESDLDLRPSPLLRGIPAVERDKVLPQSPPPYLGWQRESGRLTALRDETGPPLPQPWPQPGGSRVLQLQAACPFQAFATYRLGARVWDEAQAGLAPIERGSILHDVLERLWTEIESHERLQAFSVDELNALAANAVAETLEHRSSRYSTLRRRRMRSIEQERLTRLLLGWLEVEKGRKEPFRVLRQESQTSTTIGGLQLDLRIDRVDELRDGRHVLVDYKSGDTSVKYWEGDRPDEPQLPCYAMTPELNLAAVLFAQFKAGKLGFKGYSDGNHIVPEIRSPRGGWQPQLKQWRRVLERLATEFLEGHAAVSPKASKTCERCKLEAVCRIAERDLDAGAKAKEAAIE